MSDGREMPSEEVKTLSAMASPAGNATPSPALAQQTEPPHEHNWIPADCTHTKPVQPAAPLRAVHWGMIGSLRPKAHIKHVRVAVILKGSKLTWGEWSN